VTKQRLPGSGEKPLDRWLRELMPGKSWNEVRRLARTGKIFVDGVALPALTAASLIGSMPATSAEEWRTRPRARAANAV